jgi:competence protein ComEA
MDRSATPWRVLDDSVASTPDAGAADEEGAVGPSWLTARLVAGLALACALAVAAFVLAATGPAGSVEIDGGAAWSSDGPSSSDAAGPAAGGAVVVVDVQGAVVAPGVQRLSGGSRVADAIAAAGGYGPRVDAARAAAELNLAAPVKDGDRIVVPARGDAGPSAPSGATGGGGRSGGGLVDLNSATASELDALPGVGPVTAQKIIDARAEKPFASVDELRERKIVGAATFEKLQALVTAR